MDKDEIKRKTEEAILKEEMALPVYADHIGNALFWSGLDEAKRKKISQDLAVLLHDSANHVRLLRKVLKML